MRTRQSAHYWKWARYPKVPHLPFREATHPSPVFWLIQVFFQGHFSLSPWQPLCYGMDAGWGVFTKLCSVWGVCCEFDPFWYFVEMNWWMFWLWFKWCRFAKLVIRCGDSMVIICTCKCVQVFLFCSKSANEKKHLDFVMLCTQVFSHSLSHSYTHTHRCTLSHNTTINQGRNWLNKYFISYHIYRIAQTPTSLR